MARWNKKGSPSGPVNPTDFLIAFTPDVAHVFGSPGTGMVAPYPA